MNPLEVQHDRGVYAMLYSVKNIPRSQYGWAGAETSNRSDKFSINCTNRRSSGESLVIWSGFDCIIGVYKLPAPDQYGK